MDGVKLIMQWDIREGMDQEYFEFVVREWVPVTSRIGLQATGAWFTVYSREESPQIMAEAVTDDSETMRAALKSEDWKQLQLKLQQFVYNYSQKIVRMSNGFQM